MITLSKAEARKLGIEKPARSKFGVDNSAHGKLARTFQGILYASKFEASIAAELELKKRAKIIKDWIRQVRVPLLVNGQLICTMVIDFKIFHTDNTVELLESKGAETPVYKLQRKLIAAIHPDWKYTVRKQRG